MAQENTRIIDLDHYYASPAECCVALNISQPTLTKRIREGKLRSVTIGRTRLIEKPRGPRAGELK
jgi:excisionase family DNA binding protein